MSDIKMSFDAPANVYMLLFLGFVPMGTTFFEHKCAEYGEGCGLVTELMTEFSAVWATDSLTTEGETAELDEGTLSGVAVIVDHATGLYEVMANDYDGLERYGQLNREQAETLIASGVLG